MCQESTTSHERLFYEWVIVKAVDEFDRYWIHSHGSLMISSHSLLKPYAKVSCETSVFFRTWQFKPFWWAVAPVVSSTLLTVISCPQPERSLQAQRSSDQVVSDTSRVEFVENFKEYLGASLLRSRYSKPGRGFGGGRDCGVGQGNGEKLEGNSPPEDEQGRGKKEQNMWNFVQFLNSLVAPQSDAEKAGALERKYFEGATDTETAVPPEARSSSRPVGTNGERAVQKLKGYFSLAKGEIEKGVRSEEWGLTDDAVAHYKKANHILVEGVSAPLDVEPGSASSENVASYRQKMIQWQEKVLERLRVLNHRSEGPSKVQVMNKRPAVNNTPKRRPIPPIGKPSQVTPSRAPVNHSTRQPAPANVNTPSVAIKGLDPKLVEAIENDIVDKTPAVKWDDIAGLARAKLALMEMVILPSIRSDLFQGLRKPARGLLLFGPPGNGKTMLAKAVASESAATFFSISASSLTSKWVGEGEKLVKALFGIAAARQPSVIFVDEIDSVMSARAAGEHEASRRLKTEFLVQFDGVISNENDRIIVMAATNRPDELDDAVRRRLVKRIYIPLPDSEGRKALLTNLLKGQTTFSLHGSELEKLIKDTDGYSGSDLHALCQEAAMMPLRELGSQISTIRPDQVRALTYRDFKAALKVIRPSVSREQLAQYEQFNSEFGSLG